MNSYKNIFSLALLESIHPLSGTLKQYLSGKIKYKTYPKGFMLNKVGELCHHIYVIRKGLVRGYFVVNKKEVTTWISVDGELVTSISGFFKKEPSMENMQCIEDCILEYLHFDDLNYAIGHFLEMRELTRILLENYYISAENRAFVARIPGAKERILYFQQNFNAAIIKRSPKRHIASLLCMRPETFSRLYKPEQE